MKSKIKLTPWYPGDVKPVRVGVYERDYKLSYSVYSFWNGKYFCSACRTPSSAMATRCEISPYQNDPWRGVAK